MKRLTNGKGSLQRHAGGPSQRLSWGCAVTGNGWLKSAHSGLADMGRAKLFIRLPTP